MDVRIGTRYPDESFIGDFYVTLRSHVGAEKRLKEESESF